jgi:hypothetical protein
MPNPSLPPEILDHIADFLQDDIESLFQCCLVSKSWVPRTRKHLFAVAEFRSPNDIDAWKETFPDSSNSPARYARTLKMNIFPVADEDATEGGWIPTFSRVEHLDLDNDLSLRLGDSSEIVSLAPFSRFSPTLKTLRVTSFFLPRSRVFNLIRSLPLLEDLAIIGVDFGKDDEEDGGARTAVSSPASPKLTGSLELLGEMARPAHRLLSLPSGVHFRSIVLSWGDEEDFRYLMELVVACSDTLEDFTVINGPTGAIYPVPFSAQPFIRHITRP